MSYGVVYLITNTVNGKRYVGQTTYDPEKYWQHRLADAENGDDRPPLICRAIRKHGRDAFTFEVIWHANSKGSLDQSEDSFIQLFETMAPAGYNIRGGGSRGKHTPEAKAAMRHALSSPEARKRKSIAAIEVNSRPHVKKKIREATKEFFDKPGSRERHGQIVSSALLGNPEALAAISQASSGSRWINNGSENVRLKPEAALPDGWVYGRYFSDEKKAEISKALSSALSDPKVKEKLKSIWEARPPRKIRNRMRQGTPEFREACQENARYGQHVRWHVNRGAFNSCCNFCRELREDGEPLAGQFELGFDSNC